MTLYESPRDRRWYLSAGIPLPRWLNWLWSRLAHRPRIVRR